MIQLDVYVTFDGCRNFIAGINDKLRKMQKDGCKIIKVDIPTYHSEGMNHNAICIAYITYDKDE
jgi:hypothetical protein